jgi:hypothetical protein
VDTWTRTRFRLEARLNKEYSALDLEGRRIFAVSPVEGKLDRYDMDARTLAAVADAPTRVPINSIHFVWDSVSKVVLWAESSGTSHIKLHVYHSDTGTWEANVPIRQPEGIPVRGTNLVLYRYDLGSRPSAR